MPDVNHLAVLGATIAAFVSGAVYYTVFGEQLAEVSEAAAAGERPPPWKLAAELLRCLIIAAVVAGLARKARSMSGPAACCWGWRCGSDSRSSCGRAR